jgi:hypothetical protein
MAYDPKKYFAADDADKCSGYLLQKGRVWFQSINQNRYLDKLRRSWQSYHGAYYEDGHAISFAGESGELVNFAVNHYRNIASHMLTLTTSNRPSFQARSVNTDYRSQVETVLANGLLEYYMREKRLEENLKSAAEYAIVMGSGYIKMEWNATDGKIYDYIEPDEDEIEDYDEDGEPLDKEGNVLQAFPIYEGDVEFKNLSPFDVVFDSTKESIKDNDWVLIRSFKNKYDMIAKYPEFEDDILKLRTKSDDRSYRISLSPLDETVDIPVYEFFHKKTESMPDGRYMMFLSDDVVVMDTVMPYRRLPIYRISPGEILGTPYGYTPMFDLLPMQDAVNSLYSTILTNQNAFGVQNILNPRGNDVRVSQVNGALNFIEYNAQIGRPEALNLTQTPPEIFNFLQMIERAMETVSGINSVARGNPEASLKSGTALALVQSQALQFISGLQQSYIMLVEDIGTGLIELLQDFASVPRVAAIVGKNNKTKLKEFSGKDITSINRVVVDVGNAIAQTTAGRVQMADNLIQMGAVKSVEEYMSVINTGKLDTMTEGQMDQNLLIRAENERLSEGSTEVMAVATDAHSQHIREHMNVLADPDLRLDPELNARVLSHIQQHIDLLQTTDPNLLAIMGEQPLGPPMGSPVAPQNAAPDQMAQPQQSPGQMMDNPQASDVSAQTGVLPSPAQPPVDPATGLPFGKA